MVKMTKNSAMGGLLEPIKNGAIWKSVLREAVLCEAQVYVYAYHMVSWAPTEEERGDGK